MPTHVNLISIGSLTFTPKILVRQPYPYPKKDFSGNGYLAGEYPDGITSVEGVPVSAEIRVLWRDLSGSNADGCVVATTTSLADGTWRIDNLNTSLKYDVVSRHNGLNDVIMANITPATD